VIERVRVGIAIVVGAVLGLACASPMEPPPAAHAPFLLTQGLAVRGLHVEADAALDPSARDDLERLEAREVIRQSALDWLEHHDQFDPDTGELELRVRVRALSLRSRTSAWLWPDVAGTDRLEASVAALADGDLRKTFGVRTETRVGGKAWREPEARLRRLAQQLGRQIAERL
jgi:hypothetical protein